MDTNDWLLKDFCEGFNRGVETGDFRQMLKYFAPDATLTFYGSEFGPFHGRDEIAGVYRRQAPDDQIEILDVHDRNGELVVGYSWLREPDQRAGEMRFRIADGLVSHLEITV